MSSIDTCWTCGNSEIEAVKKVALAIQQRHDDGSSFEREWTNHHGLMRCDCSELIEFIRGRDKAFWDGMNSSLEQATGPDELNSFIEDSIYKQRLERDKRNYSKEAEKEMK